MLSMSDEAGETDLGGGTLQMWRVHDLVYTPQEESTEEIKKSLDFLVTGRRLQSDVIINVQPTLLVLSYCCLCNIFFKKYQFILMVRKLVTLTMA